MSVGESLGSHSLHSFAEYLQCHIESLEASSCLNSRRKPFTVLKPINLNIMASEKSAQKGGRQCCGNTTLDLPKDLYDLYKSDPEESYTQRKNRIQWIRKYWAEQWFKYKFVTPEYAKKNAIKRLWGDCLYRSLVPKNKAEAIEQGFYPYMARGPQHENADPSSLLWCRDDNLFKRNFQHAKASAKENKKLLGLDFNPGPSAPRADGTRDAEPNIIGPFYNLDGLITDISVQGAKVDHSDDDADTDEAPSSYSKAAEAKEG